VRRERARLRRRARASASRAAPQRYRKGSRARGTAAERDCRRSPRPGSYQSRRHDKMRGSTTRRSDRSVVRVLRTMAPAGEGGTPKELWPFCGGGVTPLSALPRADRSASLRRRRCGRLTQHGAAHAFNARFGAASGAFGRRPRAAISPGDRPCCRPGIGKRPASVESRTPVGIQCIVAPATRLARSNWRERDLWLTRR
jgi:hypothetical protein